MIAEPTEPIEIFICYAREDEEYRQGLEKQLRILKRQGLITIWYDREIIPGTDWQSEIDRHLKSAQIILLLVSPDFMDSDYCYSIEMQNAMERHERGEAYVIPIIVHHVYWQEAPFGKLQVLPTDARPITDHSWHNLNEAFYDVAVGIRGVINKVREEQQWRAEEERQRKTREEQLRVAKLEQQRRAEEEQQRKIREERQQEQLRQAVEAQRRLKEEQQRRAEEEQQHKIREEQRQAEGEPQLSQILHSSSSPPSALGEPTIAIPSFLRRRETAYNKSASAEKDFQVLDLRSKKRIYDRLTSTGCLGAMIGAAFLFLCIQFSWGWISYIMASLFIIASLIWFYYFLGKWSYYNDRLKAPSKRSKGP